MRVCKETRRLNAMQRYIKLRTARWWSRPVCKNCGDWVVGEKMWRYRLGWDYPYSLRWLCLECAPTIEKASNLFKQDGATFWGEV